MKNTGTEFRQNVGLADDKGNIIDRVGSEEHGMRRLVWLMGIYCRYAGYVGNQKMNERSTSGGA